MKPWLENIGDESLVHAVVTPRASRARVVESGDFLRVYVTEVPEKGRANEAARKLIAEHLRVTLSCVSLLKGPTSRHKTFLVSLGV